VRAYSRYLGINSGIARPLQPFFVFIFGAMIDEKALFSAGNRAATLRDPGDKILRSRGRCPAGSVPEGVDSPGKACGRRNGSSAERCDRTTVAGVCNSVTATIKASNQPAAFQQSSTAELKVVRDLAYYFLMDLYGNVPLDTVYGSNLDPVVNLTTGGGAGLSTANPAGPRVRFILIGALILMIREISATGNGLPVFNIMRMVRR